MATKSRLLFVQKYLYENTDDNHWISTNELIAVLEGIQVKVVDREHFTATVQVQTSQTFYGWVFTFGGKIEILEPVSVRDEYLARARRVLPVC